MNFINSNFSKYSLLPIINSLITFIIYSRFDTSEVQQSLNYILIMLFLVSINICLGIFLSQWVNTKHSTSLSYPGERILLNLTIFFSFVLLTFFSYTFGQTDTLNLYDVGNIIESFTWGMF